MSPATMDRTATRTKAPKKFPGLAGFAAWLVVVLVGALVLGLVFGLGLFKRLDAGQKVVNDLKPAFTSGRVSGSTAGINIVSSVVDATNPIMTPSGGGAAEVPELVTFVANAANLSDAAVLKTLDKKFPALANLLQAAPLSSVTAELPGLEAFLAKTLDMSTAQFGAALQSEFPALAQSFANLPTVTNGWNNVAGLSGLTRFNGSPVASVPQLRDYFKDDVLPILPAQQKNFSRLKWFPPVFSIPILLTVIGAVVVLFGLLMMGASIRGVGRKSGFAAWSVVLLVGIVVLVVVFGFQLYPRLDGGQKVVNAANPAFTTQRVTGDVAGVAMVNAIVEFADPVMTTSGGAAAEIPKLVDLVSAKTGLSDTAVVAVLLAKFPAVTHLLAAVPLTRVTAELGPFETFVEGILHDTPAALQGALPDAFPALDASINALPTVTGQWDQVAGTAGFTRFNGTPITTVPGVNAYFKDDLVPDVAKTAPQLHKLSVSPKLSFFPPLLTAIGFVVVIFALLMLFLTSVLTRRRS
jgi:hypothetical protein